MTPPEPPSVTRQVIALTSLARARSRARRGLPAAMAADARDPDVNGVLTLLRERSEQLAEECRLIGVEIDGHIRSMDEAATRLAARAHLMVEIEDAIARLSSRV